LSRTNELALARDAIGDLIALATAINTHIGLDLGYRSVILGNFLAAGMMAFVMLQFVAPGFQALIFLVQVASIGDAMRFLPTAIILTCG
jgi:hypothetical protein